MAAESSKLRTVAARSSERVDWLVSVPKTKAAVLSGPGSQEICLDNGLVRRTFRLAPNCATVALDHLQNGASLLRAVKPEAVLELNGKEYPVGGLVGQPDLAFLRTDWIDAMKADPGAFRFESYEVGRTKERLPWKRTALSHDLPWPPPGVGLTLHFRAPEAGPEGVTVDVHYELYDGLPLLAKWLVIRNGGDKPLRVNRFASEVLGVVEAESIVDSSDRWSVPNLTVVTDYSFGGMSVVNSARVVNWVEDPQYTTQVNYLLKTPCVLESRPPIGPDVDIQPGGTLTTYRTFELLHDGTDRERKGLEVRRMYRALAPWATENPLMLHLTSTDPKVAREAIDQAAEVGFEMVILSFGSGLNMEDTSPANLARFRALADYAHSKGLKLGGYSLLASRSIDESNDVINPKTGHTGGAIFGNSPCLGSRWGINYFQHLRVFLEATGFDLLEHDGSYPGDPCASTQHPGHRGLEDSQWTQYARIAEFYEWCRGRGISLNVPDWYFLVGSTKTAMGYRETNWSLPRDWQHIHARQHLYDGTWEKTPSMGWMFVPLVEYQGGGAAATIEPLKEHLPDYERHLANNLGFGAQACYRGPRLYDSDETEALVKRWVAFFKQHRAILESDVVHLRRADGRDWDGVLHVNPGLPEKGLAVLYNPTDQPIEREIDLPLYYTGLKGEARLRVGDAPEREVSLPDGHARVKVTLPAGEMTWVVVR
ncbi:MAG TPA: alpha-galactosidase [Armatimonadota bacterium]|jgi:hypothetical protein